MEPLSMQRLQGKTALVTGGNSGIGLATAELFRTHGARVAITGRDSATLERAQQASGGELLAIRSDAGCLADIDALMQQAGRHLGHLDVLFLNAAVAQPAPLEAVTEAQFDAMADVNFKGVFFTIQKALPLLREGASVIVTTSIANQLGSPNFSVYAACKAALRSLVQSLALELVGRGIRVNAISPGPIATPIWGRLGLPGEARQAIVDDIGRKSPIGRFGEPAEIAQAALFLAGDASSYIVGQELAVDGGMSLL
jgi:NAD(P)-dependent dehydrogenase (short-subunit alcohol dehydrogenase family)